MKNNVLVLLSTYNGEKYLSNLIDSILNQKGVNVNILIRDDGSQDRTIEILEKYKEQKKIQYYVGDNIGYANSFWQLVRDAKQYDYYAFCDQDDVWLEYKLERAIEKIKEIEEEELIPTLYTSNVICINDNMDIILDKPFKCERVLNIGEAFQKSILPGCTFVFNFEAKKILEQYKGYMESHDWATYAIITAFGKVIYDSNSYIYYRIHENNTIGISNNKIKDLALKIKRFFKKSNNSRSRFAKDFYECYKDVLDNKYTQTIKKLAYYKEDFLLKIKLLCDRNFKGILFRIYVILNKV